MEVVAVAILLALTIGGLALAGAYTIKEGINQAIAWTEWYQEEQKKEKKEKEQQDNAEL